ncbi:hypothetical protein ACPA2N_25995 [Ectopseudomonas hydrolytica]|uniref:hypothetical protein n=1 Tax=Ectopseudomonas hydrolytica TaxID=2493633 RepID=UPI003C2FC912
MINGLLINGAPLNAGSMGGGVEPVPVAPRDSILWEVRAMLAGEDVSELLTGTIRVEQERSAASLADCELLLDPGPIDPTWYTGKALSIHYLEWREGAWVEYLLFDGWVIRPSFEPVDSVIALECSDRLQDAIEALSIAGVDALVGGNWSADLFEDPVGRSRWDYAQERLSSRAASLNRLPGGELVVTPWAATAPAFVYGDGVTLDRSLVWSPVDLDERVNVVEVDALWRYPKLRERRDNFTWQHPNLSGLTGIGGFCVWHVDTTELPDIAMVEEGTTGAGYGAIFNREWYRLPPTVTDGTNTGQFCDPQFVWINTYADLLLGGTWTGARRWVQAATETYALRVEAPASVDAAGEVIRRDRLAVDGSDQEAASAFAEPGWSGLAAGGSYESPGDWVLNLREQERWQAALVCAVAMARVQILDAHRRNRLAFDVPTSDAMGVTLQHTLRVEDQRCRCQAPVWLLTHELSIDAQTAITTITLGVSRGGGAVDDPIVVPAPPAVPSGPGRAGPRELVTQLGGRPDSPEFDETLPGFSGNYDVPFPGSAQYPRDFRVEAPAINEFYIDELELSTSATYRVAVPNDLLEFI